MSAQTQGLKFASWNRFNRSQQNEEQLRRKTVPLYLFQVFPMPFNASPFMLGRNVLNILISAIQEMHVLKGFAESGH